MTPLAAEHRRLYIPRPQNPSPRGRRRRLSRGPSSASPPAAAFLSRPSRRPLCSPRAPSARPWRGSCRHARPSPRPSRCRAISGSGARCATATLRGAGTEGGRRCTEPVAAPCACGVGRRSPSFAAARSARVPDGFFFFFFAMPRDATGSTSSVVSSASVLTLSTCSMTGSSHSQPLSATRMYAIRLRHCSRCASHISSHSSSESAIGACAPDDVDRGSRAIPPPIKSCRSREGKK